MSPVRSAEERGRYRTGRPRRLYCCTAPTPPRPGRTPQVLGSTQSELRLGSDEADESVRHEMSPNSGPTQLWSMRRLSPVLVGACTALLRCRRVVTSPACRRTVACWLAPEAPMPRKPMSSAVLNPGWVAMAWRTAARVWPSSAVRAAGALPAADCGETGVRGCGPHRSWRGRSGRAGARHRGR